MRIWLSTLFLLVCCWTYGQQANQTFADAAFVYKGFISGGTNAGLRAYSSVIDTSGSVKKIRLNTSYLDTLNFLIGKVKARRHRQQKVGRSFCASILKDGKERKIAIVPDYAIIDLQNRKEYIFARTEFLTFTRDLLPETIIKGRILLSSQPL
ncbi:hypothetical protein [Mucilaginibacter terrae]|uniref:Uncharacterized protein n=1 Tax=Mucilaginibacter terrae TaxID=1955052 RepID=A0ABU3GNE6_9SPHI|nr:hypothetical protein [Mucilaginibacter terrae]MDT3401303.1 hypothetical protein [Mucilaginibacter terrae]